MRIAHAGNCSRPFSFASTGDPAPVIVILAQIRTRNLGNANECGRIIKSAGGIERASMSVKKALTSALFLLGFSAICFSAARSADELKPPDIYIDKGACPFECCTYREWVARTDMTLLDAPDGKKAVGQIKKGEKVLALTGETHSIPQQIVSPHDYPDAGVKTGDKIYLLHYVGEGFWRVWHEGKLIEIDGLPERGPKPKSTWWVELKTSTGIIGWTIERHSFENQDACG
jgi:hypothetical protein